MPDLAALRDTARRKWVRYLAGIFALGWRGSAQHWQRHQMLYLLLAGLATPLVVSVHSIVSLDFSVSVVPGWHSTIFPPYFVAGAIFSGFAMVLTIAIPLRRFFHLRELIIEKHLDNMAKVMLTAGLVVAYGYLMEAFLAWFSAESFEMEMMRRRALGVYAPIFWLMIFCNVLIPQLLWSRRVRHSAKGLFVLSLIVNLGMWLERYVIVVTSLQRDYLPSAWYVFRATLLDWSVFLGTLGTFTLLMLLFIRLLPMISVYEMREYIHLRSAVTPSSEAHRERVDAVVRVEDPERFGTAAEFDEAGKFIRAVHQTRAAGYRRIDAYSPFPVEGLAEALGLGPTRIPLLVLLGALLGGSSIYLLQWYSAVILYPWNVGGRSLHSWQSFIPLTFELSVLGGALCGFLGLFVLNRMPKYYHPMFNLPGFERASRDRFFLVIHREDPRYRAERVWNHLENLRPLRVSDVRR
jgi:hypothetical protein